MRVLIGGPYPLPDSEPYGGSKEVTYNLVNALNQIKGVDLEVLSRTEEKQDFKYEKKNHVVINYVSHKKPKLLSHLVRDIPVIRRKLRKINPEIIHAQNPVIAYCGIKEKFKTILTLHGIIWKEVNYYSGWSGMGQKLVYPRLLQEVLNHIEHIVLINPYVKEELNGRTKAQMHLIENPINEQYFKICNREEKLRIFNLGFIRKRKNVMALIKSIQLLDPDLRVKLMLGGKPDEKSYYSMLMDYINKNDLTKIVTFLGYLSKQQILEEYSKMSIFCLPSKQETAPMVISEAMAAGKPVIASNICGIPYMIKNGKTGYLAGSDDHKKWADRIQELLNDPELRKRMGKEGRRVAIARWHPDTVANETVNMYKNVMNW